MSTKYIKIRTVIKDQRKKENISHYNIGYKAKYYRGKKTR